MTYWYTVGAQPYPWTEEQLKQIYYLRRNLKLTYPQIVKELGLDVSPSTVCKKYKALLEEASIAPARPQDQEECPLASVEDEWPEWTFSEDWWKDWEGFEPSGTSGSLNVGARPWQITPTQPVLRVSSEVQAPVAITVGDDRVRFEFLPEWDQLPRWIKRVAAAVAIDMATVAVFGPTEFYLDGFLGHFESTHDPSLEVQHIVNTLNDPKFIEKATYSIEKFAQDVIDNPNEVADIAEAESFESFDIDFFAYIRPPSIETAINFLMNDWIEPSILEAISSFECYEHRGPSPAEEDLAGDIESYYDSDLPSLSYSWRFPNPRNTAALRDCMEPWLNIWWQQVQHTVAFDLDSERAQELARLFREKTPQQLIHIENPPVLAQLADEGIYHWSYEQDLINDIDELETITYQPQVWQGAGWYQYNFGDPEVPVEYLGTSLSAEVMRSIL